MNTKIIYNLKIVVNKPVSAGGFTEYVKLEEDAYKTLLKNIEQNKFITVINTKQDAITIRTDYIYKIETTIDVESDIKIKETEE